MRGTAPQAAAVAGVRPGLAARQDEKWDRWERWDGAAAGFGLG